MLLRKTDEVRRLDRDFVSYMHTRVECKNAKKDLKLLKKPCALLSHGTAAISQVI